MPNKQTLVDIIKELIKDQAVALVFLGSVLLLEGAAGGFPRPWVVVDDLLGRISLISVGALIFVVASIVILWTHVMRTKGASAPSDRLLAVPDLQSLMSRSICEAIGKEGSRVFHAPVPYVLPICFKNPKRPEYTYVVVGGSPEDESDFITTQPSLPSSSVNSIQIHHVRWYALMSSQPLDSITFKSNLATTDFETFKAEIHRVGKWNSMAPVRLPKNRQRAYAVAITEQKGSAA